MSRSVIKNLTETGRLKYCDETIAFTKTIEASFLELGRRLKVIRDERLYEVSWEDFASYLMEFRNLSESSASKLINLYEVYVLRYAFPVKRIADVGGWSLLAEALPVIKDKQSAEHWLTQATLLTRTDLRREIKEAKTGKEMRKCDHKKRYVFSYCPTCGLKERIHE